MARGPSSRIPDFRRVTAQLRRAPEVAKQAIDDFAERETLILKHRIENQEFESFEAVPLSENWLAFKQKNALDLRTMIATGHYLSRIRVIRRKLKRGMSWLIGFSPQDRAFDPVTKEPTSLPLNLLAAVHEYGSAKAHVPARPHWGPAFADLQTRVPDVMSTIRRRVIGK